MKKENTISFTLTILIVGLLFLSGNPDSRAYSNDCRYGYGGFGYGYGNGCGYGYGYGADVSNPIASEETTNQGLSGSWNKIKEKVKEIKEIKVVVKPDFKEEVKEKNIIEETTEQTTKEQTTSYKVFTAVGSFFVDFFKWIWGLFT